jgi:hypothetical protein
MAITRTQIARQLYRYGGDTMGGPNDKSVGGPGPDDRGSREQNRNQRNIVRSADDKERQKIIEKIQEPTTTFQKIKRNPFFQAASFITNPFSFGLQKIMDSKRAKRINELFGVDDDLGYTGSDAGFVVSQPTKPESIPDNDGNDGLQQIIPPTEMIATTPYQKDLVEEELSPIELALQQRDEMGGARAFAKEGGIMDLEQARQGYKLGKLVKKIGRSLKKIGKSSIGKAALAAAAFVPFGDNGSLFTRFRDSNFIQDMDRKDMFGLAAAAGLTAAPFIFGEDDTEEEYQKFLASRGTSGQELNIQGIRKDPYAVLGRAFVAEGGKPEPVAKKTLPLLDMGGKEMDLREEGGFVPIGRMEKADDVPARLSKNEFVFTADAVRNAGQGDVDKGSEVMYNMMKNLEAGGEVSEESQGLEGARKMFQTSQRLEEVL